MALSGALIGNGGLPTIGIQPAAKTAKRLAEKLGKLAIFAADGCRNRFAQHGGPPAEDGHTIGGKVEQVGHLGGDGRRELPFHFWPRLTILPRP